MTKKATGEQNRGEKASEGPLADRRPSREEDEAVLRAVVEGDRGAFDQFVQRFGNRILGFGMRMCGHREDAEDVFQDTLSTVFEKARQLREPKALTTWLYRIVANSCRLRRRRSKFAPKEELSLEALLPGGGVEPLNRAVALGDDPEDTLYRREIAEQLEEAVRELPPPQRMVWMMRDVEGLSIAETAEALDISVPNVKMRLHRARAALRERLSGLRRSAEGDGDPRPEG